MATEMRKTGIDVVGDTPWGTHFCLFYETKEDLLDTLVSYCKAGLESQEFCLWVVAEPLGEEEALHGLKQAVPELGRYLADHSIEIARARDWYLQDGTFDLHRVVGGWNETLARALARGYAGVRVTGDTAWLEMKDWKDFCEYEETLNGSVANQRLTVLCTYALAACGAAEILDVARTHQFAIAKRHGSWDVIETPGLKQSKAEIKRLNEELEQRVVERTRQLTAVNEELRKENLERKRAEEGLRESEKRYRYIFQTTGVSIWEEDFSQVRAAIDDLQAQGVRNLRRYTAAHPEFVRQAVSMVKVIDVNDSTVRLFEAQSKDELLVSLDKIFLPETEEVFAGELVAIAEGRTSFESETILRTLKGAKLTVLCAITFPPQPAKLDSVLVSIMDITQRKQAEEELRKAQAELAHFTRVTTMGELASSIVHEVAQPLAAVATDSTACLRWLAGTSPNLEEARECLQRIIRDGKRAGEVIARIRSLVTKSAPAKERIDRNETIQEVLAMIDAEARRHRVLVRTELAAGLPPVRGDRVQLQQVILNLVMNGIEAMKAVTDRPRELVIRSEPHESGEVLVTVQDSGIGLDAQNMERLFEPFYTTKPEGMGMGLSISRSIIKAHGGRLWAKPNDGLGATFQFTLPTDDGNQHD